MVADKVAERMLFKVERRKQVDANSWLYLGWRIYEGDGERVALLVAVTDGIARYKYFNLDPARFWLAAPYLRRQ